LRLRLSFFRVALQNPVTHKLEVNPVTWPRGFKALADYLHARKLKISAYSDTGSVGLGTVA